MIRTSFPDRSLGQLRRTRLLLVLGALAVSVPVGWAVGEAPANYATFSTAVAITLLISLVIVRNIAVWLIATSIAMSIFVDNFAGSAVHFQVLLGQAIFPGELLLSLLLLAVLSYRLVTHRGLRLPSRMIAWFVWLAMLLQAALRAPDSALGMKYFVQIGLLGLVISVTMSNLPWTAAQHRLLVQALTSIATAIAAIVVFERLTGQHLIEHERRLAYLEDVRDFEIGQTGIYRAGGVFGQPDWLGGFLVLFVVTSLGLAASSTQPTKRGVWLGCHLLLQGALWASGTRLGLIGMTVSLAVFVILSIRSSSGVHGFSRVAFFTTFVAGSAILITTLPQLDFLDVTSARLSSTDEGANHRLGTALTGLRMVSAFPLWGIGIGYHHYQKLSLSYLDERAWAPMVQPHNSYIEVAAFAGIPALLGLLFLLQGYIRRLRQAHSHCLRPDLLHLAVYASLLGFLAANFAVNLLTMPGISYCFWLLLSSQLEVDRQSMSLPKQD